MGDFGTEEYFYKILTEYFTSMHCTVDKKDLKKLKRNDIGLLYRKDYIDFLVQKRHDLESLYSAIVEMENNNYYKYGLDFGRILELNAGPLDSITVMNGGDDENGFDITLMSKYLSNEHASELGIDHLDGEIKHFAVSDQNPEDTFTFYFFLSAFDGRKETLEDYDTFININPDEYGSIIETFAMALALDKYAIGGIVSNLYDTRLGDKTEIYAQLRKQIESRLGIVPEEYTINNGGSVVRLLKY